MNLLVLPTEHSKEDQAIWREAIKRGWKTMRFDPKKHTKIEPSAFEMVRYYGNVLHKTRIEKFLPTTFPPISPSLLQDLDISWTGRKVKKMCFGDLDMPLKEDTFIKCVDVKWLEARVYKVGEKPSSQWQGMQDTDEILVQDPVHFTHEIRCFVLDGEIQTMSYYRKDGVFCPENVPVIPPSVTVDEMTLLQVWAHDLMTPYMKEITKLPRGVVLDFGYLPYDERGHLGCGPWAFIEANEAWGSGLYDCDPSKVFDVIVASQENKL
jgi:hypothetical protein